MENIFSKLYRQQIEDPDANLLPKLDLVSSKNWLKRSKNEFRKKLDSRFNGPITSSNWVIENVLLVGGFPTGIESFRAIQAVGINTFVCLNGMDKYEFYNYEYNLSEDQFIHVPIEDMGVTDDAIVLELCENIAKRILDGDTVYIHCAGGHGRTGVITAIVLHVLYPSLTYEQIINYIQFVHDNRDGCYGSKLYCHRIEDPELANCFALGQVPVPQATIQREQVRRIMEEFMD